MAAKSREQIEEKGKVYLLGNEAIARGFIEGGIDVAAAYPGTPSSEIMGYLMRERKHHGYYAEWSVNEKVASEVAIAASLSDLRSMTAMKGVGINVASEPFQAFTYMGAKGGIALVVCDDISMHSSHTEQDNRLFGMQAYLPIFEPSDQQEAKEMAKDCLEWSEKWGQPVMLRSNTMLSHGGGPVSLGEVPGERKEGEYEKDPLRWVNLPANAKKMKKQLLERFEKISEDVNDIKYNWIEKAGGDKDKYGIITAGSTYSFVKDALKYMSLKVDILKLGITHPLPLKLMGEFLKGRDKVLVVEELEPLVEDQVAAFSNRNKMDVEVVGKKFVPRAGEVNISDAVKAISGFLDMDVPKGLKDAEGLKPEIGKFVVPRPPVLCSGCGHRNAFFAMNIVDRKLKKKTIKPSDIGCYTLGYFHPLNAVDVHFCMGASIGVSSGFSKAQKEDVVCTIGDSTFFHAGIPPLINAVFNKSNITVIILDNSTTAMTGHQVHPGVGHLADGEETKKVNIEEVVRACGVEFVKVVDIFDMGALVDAIRKGVEFEGVSVVIARGGCVLLEKSPGEEEVVYQVDQEICSGCNLCVDRYGCPALVLEDEHVVIIEDLCVGCGVCSHKLVCPTCAIKRVEHE
ncbi:MAG: indolepyruvate ferredoxin oxidoreductase subunit alpha [Thermoplasmata archaeon]|nr:indolepyruvate ferredoxin oxidoreductase subunit alpha [Thermoplasmata archaeon]